jgi:membrane protease YdiL (CAAX protease family)
VSGLLLRYLGQLALPAVAIVLWRLEKRPVLDLGLRPRSHWVRNGIAGLLTGLVLVVLLLSAESAAGWHVLTALHPDRSFLAPLCANLLFALLVSFSEELTYRGYCLQRIEVTLGGRAAVLLSSLIFGLVHLPNLVASQLLLWQILAALCSLVLLGVALAMGFVRSGNAVWFPWGLHFGYNLVFGLQGVMFRVDHRGPTWWVGSAKWSPESGVVGLLFGLLLVATVWWATGRRGQEASRWRGVS